ncbi:hypothetical protein P8452_05477 [Trifolium repens]|nr:hypothetical protein P8452_05477 [Trifolium repens]
MTTKAGGVQPSRAEIYIDTRTRKDGSIVTKKAAATVVPDVANGSIGINQQTTSGHELSKTTGGRIACGSLMEKERKIVYLERLHEENDSHVCWSLSFVISSLVE